MQSVAGARAAGKARGLFVTGTDTAVGKTWVAAALVQSLRAAGARVVGMKPVAAGIAPHETMNADVAALSAADGMQVPLADRNPFAYAAAIAPHLAAREAARPIDLRTIAGAYRRLAAAHDVVVVEGAGGALVPLGDTADMLDLARVLDLPVLLVVGIRLGCLNHALLSAHAIAARGLALAGWVANRIDPQMLRADENVADLARRLPAPCVADVAFGDVPRFTLPALGLWPLSSQGAPAARCDLGQACHFRHADAAGDGGKCD